jgi:hypothetical protein
MALIAQAPSLLTFAQQSLYGAYGWNCHVVRHRGCAVACLATAISPNYRSFIQALVHPTSLPNRFFINRSLRPDLSSWWVASHLFTDTWVMVAVTASVDISLAVVPSMFNSAVPIRF